MAKLKFLSQNCPWRTWHYMDAFGVIIDRADRRRPEPIYTSKKIPATTGGHVLMYPLRLGCATDCY